MGSNYEIARSLVNKPPLPGKQCLAYLMIRPLMVSSKWVQFLSDIIVDFKKEMLKCLPLRFMLLLKPIRQ